MRNPFGGFAVLVVVVLAIVVTSYTFFIVDPTEQALVLRFGQPVRDLIGAPGLYAKVPFIDTVVYIDKRILALDNERQEVLVAENQRLEVDAFVRYRIADPLRFYQSVFDVKGADAQLGGMLNSALRRTLSEASIVDIVRDKRDALMADIRVQVKAGAERFGVEVVDVRIKRADLPPENSEAVFRRMQAERQRLRRLVSRARLAAEPADQGRRRRQGDGDDRPGPAAVRPDPRRGRRRAQSHFRRGLRQGPRVFRLLSLDAGL